MRLPISQHPHLKWLIVTDDNQSVCICEGDNRNEIAAEIVEAVNSQHGLQKTIEDLLESNAKLLEEKQNASV